MISGTIYEKKTPRNVFLQVNLKITYIETMLLAKIFFRGLFSFIVPEIIASESYRPGVYLRATFTDSER